MSATQIPGTHNNRAHTTQWKARIKSVASAVFHHAVKHTGVGIVCSVAYFDPYVSFDYHPCRAEYNILQRGNWGVDLQAGSQFGYKLLFVVLVAGLFGIFFQALLFSIYKLGIGKLTPLTGSS